MHTMGIDIGTTTISVVLLDVDSGDLIGRRTVEHRAFCKGASPENRVQDPERILALTSDAMQELMEMHGKPCGIGLTGQMHGMLYVDASGEAVSPLYTWQDQGGDQIWKEGLTYAQFLKAHVGDAASGYGLTTHYYLQQTERIPKTAVKMTTISDYIGMKLTKTKEPVIAADMAASWGCCDPEKNSFRLDALQEAGMDISFLPHMSVEHKAAGWTEEGIPVLCSLGDNQASVIGSVQSMEDTVLLNVGTGSQVSMGISGYRKCGRNIELRPCLPGRYILVGGKPLRREGVCHAGTVLPGSSRRKFGKPVWTDAWAGTGFSGEIWKRAGLEYIRHFQEPGRIRRHAGGSKGSVRRIFIRVP